MGTPEVEEEKETPQKQNLAAILALSLGALGVVYGDIGTSPLYAISQIFFGHEGHVFSHIDVLGAISLVFWSLTLIIAIKYVFIVLRADNDGEGGVFALYSLLGKLPKASPGVVGLLIIAAGLLYGDGIITPAISVISAVEGVNIVTTAMQPFVIPITIVILTLLFSIQSRGTGSIGKAFGPIMLIWFAAIGLIGFKSVTGNPEVLKAVDPAYALDFLFSHSILDTFLTLGAVMLAITGGEAMYADMGHFGKTPIRLGWYLIAYPTLLLNYFGQGAFLLSGKPVLNQNIFFSMVPQPILIPMVILATIATIIASQALISGAFSLTMQAISLRLLPYLPIKHTSEEHQGQIYLPHVNWALYIGAVMLILAFRSSSNLAGAYGLAVSGVMFVTTLAMINIAKEKWHWNKILTYILFIPFLIVDGTFLMANSLKLLDGGYVPLSIGFGVFGIIKIWTWGRRAVYRAFKKQSTMTVKRLVQIQRSTPNNLPRTMVFLTRTSINSLEDHVPIQLQRYWERNAILPEHLVLLNVNFLKSPRAKERLSVTQLTEKDEPNGTVTSINVRFGFMEKPELEPLVKYFIKHKDIPSAQSPKHWIFKVTHERIVEKGNPPLWKQVAIAIYKSIYKNTDSSDHYFGLGQNHQLTIDVIPVTLS